MKENLGKYDFIAKDRTRHQDMESIIAANKRYWSYIMNSPNRAESNKISIVNIKEEIFWQWNKYFNAFMKAMEIGVLAPEFITNFAETLKRASVEILTIEEQEQYLTNLNSSNAIINTMNSEQGKQRK